MRHTSCGVRGSSSPRTHSTTDMKVHLEYDEGSYSIHRNYRDWESAVDVPLWFVVFDWLLKKARWRHYLYLSKVDERLNDQ